VTFEGGTLKHGAESIENRGLKTEAGPAAGLKSGQSNRERNFDLAEFIKKRIPNIES
jgi:hypothetical protein